MTTDRTQAYGKLMLAGEYAVLFGYPALVMAVDKKSYASFTPDSLFSFTTKTVGDARKDSGNNLFHCAEKIMRDEGFSPLIGHYVVDTSVFFDAMSGQKLGFGSSASAMASLCKIMLQQFGIDDPHQIFRIAHKAHRAFSSACGSGADIASCIFGGVLSYQIVNDLPTYQYESLAFLDDLLVVDTRIMQKTAPFVERAFSLQTSHPDFLNDFCRASSHLYNQMKNAQDLSFIVEIFTNYFQLLKNFGNVADIDITSKAHQEIFRIARAHNGAAKPSGAGGGDMSLALVPKNQKDYFIDEIDRCGFRIVPIAAAKKLSAF